MQKLRLQREALLDHIHDRLAVKIGICNRHEQIHRNAMICLHRDLLARRTQRRRHRTKPLRHIDEKILHLRDIRFLAADALHRAALAARRLLTLKTKHLSIHR